MKIFLGIVTALIVAAICTISGAVYSNSLSTNLNAQEIKHSKEISALIVGNLITEIKKINQTLIKIQDMVKSSTERTVDGN